MVYYIGCFIGDIFYFLLVIIIGANAYYGFNGSFNDNKNLLTLVTDTSDRIKAVMNFLSVLSDSICSLFIVNSNVASISLGNESFSTDEDLEYGYLINTGNHYDVYLPPELFAQAYKLNNKEMNAQLDYLNRYAI